MGDRCNIVISEDSIKDKALPEILQGSCVVFYGHWSGYEMPEQLRVALAKRWRWDDPSYLARIIWDEFCTKRGEETGFGISSDIDDNERPIMIVDVQRQVVRKSGNNGQREWTFEEYIAKPKTDLFAE